MACEVGTIGTSGQDLGPYIAALTKRHSYRMPIATLLATLINIGGSGRYVHWGFIQISVANLVVILLMIVVFILAIVLPFPRHRGRDR